MTDNANFVFTILHSENMWRMSPMTVSIETVVYVTVSIETVVYVIYFAEKVAPSILFRHLVDAVQSTSLAKPCF